MIKSTYSHNLLSKLEKHKSVNLSGIKPSDPPEYFCCVISSEVMKDPVLAPDGNTYEREAIVKWLETNPTSPITRQSMKPEQLIPNRSMKEMIGDWKQKKGIFSQSVLQLQTEIKNHRGFTQTELGLCQLIAFFSKRLNICWELIYSKNIIQQLLVDMAGIYCPQSKNPCNPKPDESILEISKYSIKYENIIVVDSDETVLLRMKFNNQNEYENFYFYYKSLYPRLIKQISPFKEFALTDVVIDTDVLMTDVMNSLRSFYRGAHKILIMHLKTTLGVSSHEVINNGAVGDILVSAAGITTKQTSSYIIKNPIRFNTTIFLKFANFAEYLEFFTYYAARYRDLILSTGDYNPFGLTSIEFNPLKLKNVFTELVKSKFSYCILT